MTVVWLTPAAWWGLAALALPVLIHLLVRHRSRHVLFPTLRFLRATRLAALRHRFIHDWPLLGVRMLILAAAVAALAGPVLISARRQPEWASRVARAMVAGPVSSVPAEMRAREEILDAERRGTVASTVFTGQARLADALRDASIWLRDQPPAAREIVVVGDLKEGLLTAADLRSIPPHVGIRFLPTPSATPGNNGAELRALKLIADQPRVQITRVDAIDAATRVSTGRAIGPAGEDQSPLRVRAAARDQPIADAALAAVLEQGILLDRAGERRVLVLFAGADTSDVPSVTRPPAAAWMRHALEQLTDLDGAQALDRLVVNVRSRAADHQAAHLIARIARVVFAEDLTVFEPRRIPAAELAAWSRAPGPVPGDARPADEGDRRWLWALALLLMVVEQILRRARQTTIESASPPAEEVRVA